MAMLQISSILGNSQWLDGGAMFGSVPRALWSRWTEVDSQGRIPLACRAFLVEDGERRILIETGVGAFFEPHLRERYGITQSQHVLLESLSARGLSPADIDVVLLSHLHFDHAGGLVGAHCEGAPLELAFPRATIVTSTAAWERAQNPHERDRASYIRPIIDLVEASGRLVLVNEKQHECAALGPRFRLTESDGHTPGMLLPILMGQKQRAIFCADLIPGAPWVHLPVTAGYDRFPEKVIDEKKALYQELSLGALLLFTHDFKLASGVLAQDDKGRFCAHDGKESLDGYDLDGG